MEILTTSASQQTFKVIPRSLLSAYKLVVRDEMKNTEVFNDDVTVGPTHDNYREIQVTFSPILKEGRYYTFELRNTLVNNLIYYKGKIFCTDQTVNQDNNDYYSVNSGEYVYDDTAGSHDNDYIII